MAIARSSITIIRCWRWCWDILRPLDCIVLPLLAFHIILLFIALVTFVAVEGSSAQRKPQTAFLSYTSWSHAGLGQCHGYSSNAILRKGRKAVCDRLKKESDATSATGRRTKSIGLTMTLARRRARGGPRQRKTKDKTDTRGAQSALHAKATGRNRVIRAQTSTSRLSCQRIGGRRMVALLCQGTLSRNHIQAASRRRHPRQAYHRHRFRPKTGSQPWRRTWLIIQAASRRRHPRQAYHRHRLRPNKGSQPWRRTWLIFDSALLGWRSASELPGWRSAPRARPLVQDSHGLGPGARAGPGARTGPGASTKLRLEVLTGSRQERYPARVKYIAIIC